MMTGYKTYKTYTTYKATFTPDNHKSRTPKYTLVDIGDGFETKFRENNQLLEKYDLGDKNLISFINNICTLVETKKAEIPTEDWEELSSALKFLMVRYDGGSLFYHILENYGPEVLNYHAWVHFSEDSAWMVCVSTFAHMPRKSLEEYMTERWEERSRTAGEEGKKTIMTVIRGRNDIYGSPTLSSSQVEEVLFSPRQFALVDLGSGFETKIRDIRVLEKYDLLGKGILTAVNRLCAIVNTKKSEIPAEDWDDLHLALRILLACYDTGELYDYLLDAYGAEALSYHAWVRFASAVDSGWRTCVKTITDMPTEILETYAANEGADKFSNEGPIEKEDILKAISQRNDIYGSESLPPEMVVGILFKSEA